MLKCIIGLFGGLLLAQTQLTAQEKPVTYLLAHYNKTLYDVTYGNNPSGVGLGLQTLFNNKGIVKPTVELSGYIYLEDDKVARLTSSEEMIEDVNAMVNIFAGLSYNVTKNSYAAVVTGPAFINGKTYLGIKPGIGVFFPENQRWTASASYINIFNRYIQTKKDFGTFSVALGLKLF